MKYVKKLNEFLSNSRFSKLLSMLEVSKDDVYYRFFYTPIKKRLISIEVTDLSVDKLPFKEGDNIQKVYDWIKENNLKIEKIKKRNEN